ncbi:MAG: DM13 domain-containing protein [Oligoflexales bacterium]|nr:DM13 domain-containing protein [Oligoflexales bacterium]
MHFRNDSDNGGSDNGGSDDGDGDDNTTGSGGQEGAIARGSFDPDLGSSSYDTGGSYTLIRQGRDLILRLEDDFFADRGPAVYFVFASYEPAEAVSTNSSVRHGELGTNGICIPPLGNSITETSGPQLYTIPIPDGFDINNFNSLILYCEAFQVVFGVADVQRL